MQSYLEYEFVMQALMRHGDVGESNAKLVIDSLRMLAQQATGSPTMAQIEPIKQCNLRCTMCIYSSEIAPLVENSHQVLTLAQLKTIAEKLPFLNMVSLCGLGEPLLNREIFEMIEYLKCRQCMVFLTTNGILLTDVIINRLGRSNVDVVVVSIDGATEKTYQSIRRGASLSDLLPKISSLVAARETYGYSLMTSMVVTKRNRHEIEDMIRLIGDLGIQKIIIQEAHGVAFRSGYYEIEDQRGWECPSDLKQKAQHLGHALGVEVIFNLRPSYTVRRTCVRPWHSVYISVEGYVAPCCKVDSVVKEYAWGNIFEQGFQEIWNSPKAEEFRRQLTSPTIPECCSHCISL